uniref:Uncharacterized protein n=1 Tax=Arundo donax TaxID=35708 RepID=A0A0A9BF71_ARUDO
MEHCSVNNTLATVIKVTVLFVR